MAKKRKGGPRAGRESPKHKQHKPSRAKQNAYKQSRNLVDDRIGYLTHSLTPTLEFRNKREAERFRESALSELGASYDLQSRKRGNKTEWRVKLRSIFPRNVERSSSFHQIQRGLYSKSNAAKGAKAKALVQLGRRETFWNFAVGESNP